MSDEIFEFSLGISPNVENFFSINQIPAFIVDTETLISFECKITKELSIEEEI